MPSELQEPTGVLTGKSVVVRIAKYYFFHPGIGLL